MIFFEDITNQFAYVTKKTSRDASKGDTNSDSWGFSKTLIDFWLDKTLQPWVFNEMVTGNILKKEGSPVINGMNPRILFDFKNRTVYDNLQSDYKRTNEIKLFFENFKIFMLTGDSTNPNLLRYFAVYITPKLKENISNGAKTVSVNIFLHPYSKNMAINNNNYFKNNRIGEYFKDLLIRYCISEQKLALQHRYSAKSDDDLRKPNSIPTCLIFPVFSDFAFNLFPDYEFLNSKLSFFDIIDNLLKIAIPKLTGMDNDLIYDKSLSAFSFGASQIKKIFDNKSKLMWFNSVFLFDPVVFNASKEDKETLTKEEIQKKKNEITKLFISNLSAWQLKYDKKTIRIYISNGDYDNITSTVGIKTYIGHFKEFNEKKRNLQDGKIDTVYKELHDAFEYVSQNNNLTVFKFPVGNFTNFKGPKNPNGIHFNEGHSWFAEKFLCHAISNSSF